MSWGNWISDIIVIYWQIALFKCPEGKLSSLPIFGVDKVIKGQLFPIKIRHAPVPTLGDWRRVDKKVVRTTEDKSIMNLSLLRVARRAERLSSEWGKAVCKFWLRVVCSRMSVHDNISDWFRQSRIGQFHSELSSWLVVSLVAIAVFGTFCGRFFDYYYY